MNKQIDYTELSKNVILLHNKIRSDPQSFIETLEKTKKMFKGKILSKPSDIGIQTMEGESAFNEAIEFLTKQKPVPQLIQSEFLSKSTEDLVKDIGPKGITTHESSDGLSLSDRIEKYCEWESICSENIDFGGKTAEDVMMSFIVDDGVDDRGHRKNVFNPEAKNFGVSCGPHKDFEVLTVIDYTGGVRNIGEQNEDGKVLISDYCKKTMNNNKNKTNPHQKNDPHAPDNTKSVKIIKSEKTINGKKCKLTKKIYTLDDGSQFIVELNED